MATYADGTRIETDYRDGKRNRYVATYADGSRVELYFHHEKLHRTDGPSVIETRSDGTTMEAYFHAGKFIKSQTIAPLPAPTKVKRRPSAPPPTPAP